MTVIDRASIRSTRLMLVASALAAAMCGSCGGGQKVLAPEQADQRRQEIRALWAEIEHMEQGGAVSEGAAGDDGDSDAGADSQPMTDDIEAMSTARTERPTQASPPESLSVTPRRRDLCHQRRESRPPRCGDVCRLAASICDNADRICHLAGELGDDDWANDRCAAATTSCTRADARCCGCDQ